MIDGENKQGRLMKIRIAICAAALALTTQVAAQQTGQLPAWHGAADLSTAPAPHASTYAPMLAGNPLQDSLAENPLRTSMWDDRAPANRAFAQIGGSFQPQSRTATIAKQLLYTTSPLWLRHSRPFPGDSHIANQPGEGVLNQAAALVRSASKD